MTPEEQQKELERVLRSTPEAEIPSLPEMPEPPEPGESGPFRSSGFRHDENRPGVPLIGGIGESGPDHPDAEARTLEANVDLDDLVAYLFDRMVLE